MVQNNESGWSGQQKDTQHYSEYHFLTWLKIIYQPVSVSNPILLKQPEFL